jgi:pyruvate dehydrogenase E2 component (dihydrolipoamide acetyltransferase)
MADRMTSAWTTIPHFALAREVDASALRDMRAGLVASVSKRAGVAPTYTDMLVKLLAVAIARQPRINASWRDGSIEQHAEINIGIAVATDDGLVVPVIQRADGLSMADIAVRRRDLAERATAGKLTPADITGGTFTLTNLGMYGVDAFAAIVNPPQAAILAAGRIADRVVALDGQPAVRPTMILTLSCDHRAIDGARAAQFLDELIGLVEEPWGLLA